MNRAWLHNGFKVEIILIKFYALSAYTSYKLLIHFLSFFQFWGFFCIISPFSLSFCLELLFIWILDCLENLFFFLFPNVHFLSFYNTFLKIYFILFFIPYIYFFNFVFILKSAFYPLVLFFFLLKYCSCFIIWIFLLVSWFVSISL